MSYQALYRVWRPQEFRDVSGQQMITQTLKNAIKQDNTSHAYLFSGPRGTGKTSAAKIFAKAINCPNSIDGEPCNQCDICKQITDGSLGDVIEIDAASNNGVEEIRDIREKANYAPTQADYKIYIIDEVHMLSMGAFNALLKTLEEPPTNVIFILATTEPHKIPLTIISRTQRFDFRRISSRDIVERMSYILNQKEIDYEEEALQIIANAAEGGMRDGLSMLDQALSFMDEKLTVDITLQITGSITQDLLIKYIHTVIDQDTATGLEILDEILAEGKDASRFIEDMILICRDILLYKNAEAGDIALKLAKIDEEFKQLSQVIETDLAYKMIEVLNATQRELKMSNHAEVYLEVATVRLTQNQPQVSEQNTSQNQKSNVDSEEVSQLKKQMSEMQQMMDKMKAEMVNGSKTDVQANKSEPKKLKKSSGGFKPFKVNLPAVHKVLAEATKGNLVELKEVWGDLIDVLDTSKKAILNNSIPVAASPNGLVVTFEYDILCEKAENDEELHESIANYLEKIIDKRPQLICVPANQWPTIRQNYIQQMKQSKAEKTETKQTESESKENIGNPDEVVDKAVELFGKDRVNIK